MNISIVYNGTDLYPEHIYSWSRSGINCGTDDYSIGCVNQEKIKFRSDIKPNIGDIINDGKYDFRVTEVTKSSGTTYDVVCLSSDIDYDVVVDDWFQSLTFPITLNNLAKSLLSWLIGSSYTNDVVTRNASYQIIKQFGYSGLTARQVLQWIAQLDAGNFRSIVKENGAYNLAKFSPTQTHTYTLAFTPSNAKKVEMADYQVPAIDRVWFGSDASDVGISYGTGTEQLSIPYNPLINPDSTSFVQTIYDRVSLAAPYTPMKITAFLDCLTNWYDFITGNTTISYAVDGTTYYCPVFNYSISQKGVEIEGTGNSSRAAANTLIASEIQQAGKYNKFSRTLDATISEIGDIEGNVSTLTQTVNGLTSTVSTLTPKSSAIQTDTLYYLATSASSGVTRSTSGWTTTVQAMTATNQYLWTYHEYTYADNHKGYSDPVITGRYGQNGTNGTNGTNGVGITSITTLYRNKANTTAPAKPTAHVTQTGNVNNAWTTAVPSLSSSYPYLFTCDEILYTNGTYGWTDVVQNNALTTFNSTLSQQADKISLVVTENQGSNVINAASIVTAVNNAGSSVTISADHINLQGSVAVGANSDTGTASISTEPTAAYMASNNFAVSKIYNNSLNVYNFSAGVTPVYSGSGRNYDAYTQQQGAGFYESNRNNENVIKLTSGAGAYVSATTPNLGHPQLYMYNRDGNSEQSGIWLVNGSSATVSGVTTTRILPYKYSLMTGTGTGYRERMRLRQDELIFVDSTGVQTARYPASLSASRVLVTDSGKNVTASTVTATELSYLSGVTSNIQQQINNITPDFSNGLDFTVNGTRITLNEYGLRFYDSNNVLKQEYPSGTQTSPYWRVTAGSGNWNIRATPGGTIITTVGPGDYPFIEYNSDQSSAKIVYDGTNQGWIGASSGSIIYK